jgi:hypothetical protein
MLSHITFTRILIPIDFPRIQSLMQERSTVVSTQDQDRIFPSADVSVVRLDYSVTCVASTHLHMNYFTTRVILNPSLKSAGVCNADG